MRENQIALATELMKGRVTTPCVSKETMCPLLDTKKGCTSDEGLIMGNNSVECPIGKGVIRIGSERLTPIEMLPEERFSLAEASA